MNPTITALEQQRRQSVAREYEQEGYRVIEQPKQEDRPSFLAEFEPDIIAYGPRDNVVVEVKSRATIARKQHLVALAEAINAQPGWRLDLVMANPKERPVVNFGSALLDNDEVHRRVEEARHQLVEEHPEVALLLGCSAVEVVLRRFGATIRIDTDFAHGEYLLREAYIFGVIGSRKVHATLREALQQRDAIVHGYRADDDLGGLAARVIAIAEQLLTVDVAALAS